MFRGRVPAKNEPYWLETDRSHALAWQAESRSEHTCGQPAAESMARENQTAYDAEVIRCHACAAMQRRIEEFGKQDGADMAGVRARLIRTPHGAI